VVKSKKAVVAELESKSQIILFESFANGLPGCGRISLDSGRTLVSVGWVLLEKLEKTQGS